MNMVMFMCLFHRIHSWNMIGRGVKLIILCYKNNNLASTYCYYTKYNFKYNSFTHLIYADIMFPCKPVTIHRRMKEQQTK